MAEAGTDSLSLRLCLSVSLSLSLSHFLLSLEKTHQIPFTNLTRPLGIKNGQGPGVLQLKVSTESKLYNNNNNNNNYKL